MPQITDVSFTYGAITFKHEIEALPPTSETTGNVTINNVGSPGLPAHFEASHVISCTLEEAGLSARNTIYWTTLVAETSKTATYLSVEAEAARQLAPMLREVAQIIENQVAEFDAKTSAKAQKDLEKQG